MTDERRQRDISIAKKLGWTVRKCSFWWQLVDPSGEVVSLRANDTERLAWQEFTVAYSTDPAACMALLVEVMGRGWKLEYEYACTVDWEYSYWASLTRAADNYEIHEKSALTDPALAFCDAVSQACDAALEEEVKA